MKSKKTKLVGKALLIVGLIGILSIILLLFSGNHLSKKVQIFGFLGFLLAFNLGLALTQIGKEKRLRLRASRIFLIIGVVLILGGWIFILMKWPSARIQLIVGVNVLCFAAGPLIVKNRFEKWKPFTSNTLHAMGLSIIDLLSIVLLFMGALFKLQFWPGAGLMLTLGSVFLIVAFLLWNIVLKKIIIKQHETERELTKAHESLHHKHQQVEIAHKEILDSINYAKRLQSAILPPKKLVTRYLPESFILYKPKDIVAGDFYWMEHVKETILFAAADCTGHGVPGAMVSVICNNGLNRSVREYGLSDPGKILDKTREIVVSEFEKSEEEVKDGMDISLCVLNLKTKKLHWAGANNPIWIIRDGELLETKPDKQPIGVVDNPQPFTTHKIELQQGDTIYIFTDGFQDQFGGEKGKKFKPANFKKLLTSIHTESMEKQREIIDETFEKWKGELEHLDDVCVIGVKV